MALERCQSCDKLVDLDTNVEGIIYLDTKAICDSCIDDEYYQEYIDNLEKRNIELKNKLRRAIELIEHIPDDALGVSLGKEGDPDFPYKAQFLDEIRIGGPR